MPDLSRDHDDLYERIAQIIEGARGQAARTINTAMVVAYWLIGREIVEVEQRGESRAAYGEQLVHQLALRLTKHYGKGFSYPSVKRMKQFYLTFPRGSAIVQPAGAGKSSTPSSLFESGGKGSTPSSLSAGTIAPPFPALLSWSHYLVLLRVQSDPARSFYEIEAAREGWSVRELERQTGSHLYERLAKSRDKDEVLALAKRGQTVTKPTDLIKDPFVLEFLGLEERSTWRERDLEQAIIDRLESFLLELGKGCWHRALLRQERRHGQDHASRRQTASPCEPLPALPPDRAGTPRRARTRASGCRTNTPPCSRRRG